MALKLLQCISGACLGRDGSLERFGVEFGAPPRDVGIVHIVRDAKIVERTEAATLNANVDACLEYEVLLAERQKICPIRAFWGGREAE